MKRRIAKLVIFLLLGAIVNVAVAWGCALWLPPKRIVGMFLHTGLSTTRFGWEAKLIEADEADQVKRNTDVAGRVLYRRSKEIHHTELGWPLLSLRWQPDPIRRRIGWKYGLVVPEWLAAQPSSSDPLHPNSHRRHLPLRPLWPGFAVNTIFYAAILWVLFTAPGSVRRWRRRRRGLCPACAYPVGQSLTCTECGEAVVQNRARQEAAA
jgi:hypothetical protein